MRVIIAELTRLLNHACFVGFLLSDMRRLGHAAAVRLPRARKNPRSLRSSLSGARMMCNYHALRRLPRAIRPPSWLDAARELVDDFPRFLDEYETLLTGNEIMLARTQGIGRSRPDRAINAGITGPVLRA